MITMKKIFLMTIALILAVNITACGGKEASVESNSNVNTLSQTEAADSQETELNDADEAENQNAPEIADTANTPKDISKINPDDYWQGDDYFDLERFLIDCGCEIDVVEQDEEADAGFIFFYLPDKKSLVEFNGAAWLPNTIVFWYDAERPVSMSEKGYSVSITIDEVQKRTNYEHIPIKKTDVDQIYRLIKLVANGYDGTYCPFAGCGYDHFYEIYTMHSENE